MESTYDLSKDEMFCLTASHKNVQNFISKMEARFETVRAALAHQPELQEAAKPPAPLAYLRAIEEQYEALFADEHICKLERPNTQQMVDEMFSKLMGTPHQK